MDILKLQLPGIFELKPRKFGDTRGFFSETFSNAAMTAHNLPTTWVQDNHSFSAEKYVLRGLHYQSPPVAQDKLVRVVRGSIFDVAVDIRKGSPHFGKWLSLVVSADAWNQILVPKGFAHGFLTLEPDTEVVYKVSAPYSPAHEHSIRWDDPELAINWPLAGHLPVLSAKDKISPSFKDYNHVFTYGELTA
jgi:dTDP-4-dehydrorhamnose 3,5-epimerase